MPSVYKMTSIRDTRVSIHTGVLLLLMLVIKLFWRKRGRDSRGRQERMAEYTLVLLLPFLIIFP